VPTESQPDDREIPSDPQLVKLAVAGDKTAANTLFERHRPRLHRILTGLLWDADEAETLVQEVHLKAFEMLADYRPEHQFSAWLTGIGINLARNTLRTRARRAAVIDPALLNGVLAPEGQQRGVLSGILKRELNDRLYRALDELPVSLREVVVLHELEGLPYEEISQLTGVSEGTLRVRAHRARGLLKESLGTAVDTWWQRPLD
jgi:RNA polymerase sigma-70 factor, ECF subfamily